MLRNLICALFLLHVAAASATTIIYKNLDQLAAESEGIVVGTVAAKTSAYGPDKSTIYTLVTLEGLDAIKGQVKGYDLTLRFEGGRVENDVLRIEGSPRFEIGERVVLFVRGNGRAKIPLVGWTQGVFRVVQDASGKPVVSDHEGNKLFGVSGKDLVKEKRIAPDASILEKGHRNEQSNPPQADPGVPDKGGGAVANKAEALPPGPPMSLDAFVASVKSRATTGAKANAVAPAVLESAGLPDVVPPRAVGAPRSADAPAGLKQGAQAASPAKRSAPALPRRIPQNDTTPMQ